MCEASDLPFDLSNLSLVKAGTTLLYFHSAPSEPFNRFMGLTSSKDGGWRIDVKASAYAWESADGDWYYNDENNKPVLFAQRTDKGLGIKDFDGNLNYATTESDGQGMFFSPISIEILDEAVSVGRNPEGILQAYDSTGEAIHYYDADAGWIKIIHEDFSDLHPCFTIKEAMRATETVTRKDFESGRLLREAKSRKDLQPFNPLVEAPRLSIVTGPTGVVYVKAGSNEYPQHPERIPSEIAAAYKLENGDILILQRYWTIEGDRYLSYSFDPSTGDPAIPKYDERYVLTPTIKPYGYESIKGEVENVSDDDLLLRILFIKHNSEVEEVLRAWVEKGTLPEDIWKIPLDPSPN
jgi:hypothetical protein